MIERERARSWWPVVAGAVTGGLLFSTDFPAHAWWLQAVALLPWLWSLGRWRPGPGRGALSGAALGAVYTGGLSVMLKFPILLALGLAGYLTVFWALLGAGAAWIWRGSEKGPGGLVGAALGVACLAALVEWLNVSVIPVWGTAQVFTRVWSAAPWAIQITSVTGVLGLVWVVFALQTLAVAALAPGAGAATPGAGAATSGAGEATPGAGEATPGAARRGPALVALLGLLLLVVGANALLWPRERLGSVKVAAVGWTFENLPAGKRTPWRQTWEQVALPLVRESASRGAKLVVTPETGLWIPKGEAAVFRERVARVARELGVSLAVGWFDHARNDNRIFFVGEEGKARGEYAKTHLIMTLEKYRPGDGQRVVTALGPYRLGGMICQDDNFTDLARGYGKSGAHLLAVPTNDWREVRHYHLENSRFRAVDSRYGVVRAATNGWSAIVTARGEVLARVDHFAKGPALVVAELPLYAPGSFYARVGDWVVVAPCALWLCVLVLVRIRRARAARTRG
ncbi:MAG: nitrilase-related carbon-nitrogen hydrolase [Polyangia bacterium]|jgi:apolipoprotein N-acyltransferase|nr:nitrilase-related carbon-nitrogen hydrolase [Polyangia bacterium]